MNEEIAVALLAFFGTVAGSFGGIFASARLTTYRIRQLEEKVDKHNNFAGRMPVLEEQVKEIKSRINKIEEDIK